MTYLVDKATETLVLNVQDPMRFRSLLPQSRLLSTSSYNLATRLTLDNVRVLRNMGIEAPNPMLELYDWTGRYPPFAHQRSMGAFYTEHKRCFNLSEMGVGKTAGTLWALDWMMNQGLIRKALIITPLSTMRSVWQSDIFDVVPHRTCAVVHGSKEKRLQYLKADADIYVLNHDGLKIKEVMDAIAQRADIDIVVVDEAGMFRNWRSGKYKVLDRLVNKDRKDMRLQLLTGTPCPNDPTDAWALAKLVSPHRVTNNFGSFQRETMVKISQFKWVPKFDATKRAYDAMQPAIRFKKKDCVDLPPVTTRTIGVPLTSEQIGAVREMRKEMVAVLDSGVEITAANGGDKLNKVRQILCGAVKMGDTYVSIDHAPRRAYLLELIESASAKVIVVVPFKGIIRMLAPEISKHFSCAIVNGDVPMNRRAEIFNAFKTQLDPRVLLCHPAVMAHGLNLTEADTLIYYAPVTSSDEVAQVNERFNRTGQKNAMTIYRMSAHPIEAELYRVNDTRHGTQTSILDLYNMVLDT